MNKNCLVIYGDAIQYIIKQTERVQLESMRQDGLLLKYIINPTYYINNPHNIIQLLVIEKNINLLQYIKNPSDLVCVISGAKGEKYVNICNQYLLKMNPYLINNIIKMVISYLF